jgi:hypothetical protein
LKRRVPERIVFWLRILDQPSLSCPMKRPVSSLTEALKRLGNPYAKLQYVEDEEAIESAVPSLDFDETVSHLSDRPQMEKPAT